MRTLILCQLCIIHCNCLEQPEGLRAETFELIIKLGNILLCPHLVGLSHCVVRVIWFKYWILPDAVLLSSQLTEKTHKHRENSLSHTECKQHNSKDSNDYSHIWLLKKPKPTHLEGHCQTADCNPPQGLRCLSGPLTANSLKQQTSVCVVRISRFEITMAAIHI